MELLKKYPIIYISLPIGGYEKSVSRRYSNAIKEIDRLYSNDDLQPLVSGPTNISEFTEEGLKEPRAKDWPWYMGRDVEILLRCNTIFMTKGYLNSPGCRVELAVARERDMKVIYAKDAQESLTDEDK